MHSIIGEETEQPGCYDYYEKVGKKHVEPTEINPCHGGSRQRSYESYKAEHSTGNDVEKHADSSREDMQKVDNGTTYYNIRGRNDNETGKQEINGEDMKIMSNKRGCTQLRNEGDAHHRPHEGNIIIVAPPEG